MDGGIEGADRQVEGTSLGYYNNNSMDSDNGSEFDYYSGLQGLNDQQDSSQLENEPDNEPNSQDNDGAGGKNNTPDRLRYKGKDNGRGVEEVSALTAGS